MSHYDDLYEEYKCEKCKKTVIGCTKVHYINRHDVERNIRFKPYEGKDICNNCYWSIRIEMDIAKEFENGREVEIRNKEYEFYFKERPTGNFARGKIVESYDDNNYIVKLFCDGKSYNVDKNIIFPVTDLSKYLEE